MKVLLSILAFATLSVAVLAAQDIRIPPQKDLEQAPRTPVQVAMVQSSPSGRPAKNLFFCPNGKCLYYSGDCDSTSPFYNSLFDFDNPGIGVPDAEVWVGVKPTGDVTITGTSGNYFTNTTTIGINPTPFAVRTGVSTGNGGTLVCSTSGNAVVKTYDGGCFVEGNNNNYYIAKLARSCHLKAHKIYYVDLTPQYNDSMTFGYLWDDDGKRANKRGWPEIKDRSYFNSTSFGANYEPTWGSNGACGGGCDGFSISLTGKQR
jgi:hypothetical protein